MITYQTHTLPNGLRIVAHQDRFSAMAATNMLYCVGARDENPLRTGFAHLFEHLMFRGTRQIPQFDIPVQLAGGENNAFTNNDYTDYYIVLPENNLATAFWLESDRMGGLDITPQKLDAEKKVVIEEYKQRYLNQPYGDQWMLLRALAYRVHPYRWATIGLTPEHIEHATLEDVQSFYHKYYTPSNAILSVASPLPVEQVFDMADHWFGDLPAVPTKKAPLPAEPAQTEARRMEVERDVPAVSLTIAFPMGGRTSEDFYCCDVISDLLAGGTSSRLYRHLVREKRLFSAVNAYVTGDLDPGLFVLTGQLMPGIDVEQAENSFREEMGVLQRDCTDGYELDKVRNKFEANTLYGELNVMNKAMNLGFYTMLGDPALINREVEIYRSVTASQIRTCAQRLFTHDKSSTLIIRPLHETR